MRFGRYFLSLSPLLGVVASASAQPAADARVSDNAVGCIRIRATPKTGALERGCVYAGTPLQLIGTAAYWDRVRTVRITPALVGWLPKKFVVGITAPAGGANGGAGGSAILNNAWLEIHFVDVGQGDAVWIHTFDDGIAGNGRYDGRNIIIDGGPDAADGKNQLLRYLQANAPEASIIDGLVISHPHDDHYPGALGILRHFEVREYYDPGFPKDGTKWADFRQAVTDERAEGHPIRQHIGAANFGTPHWGSELGVQFLYAWPGPGQDGDLGTGSTKENNTSIVMRLTYGNHSFLFMGDAEGKERSDAPDQPHFVENRLLSHPGAAALKSTVLKVAHHGSETSSTLPFIRAVDPQFLVVMSGRRSFGGTFLPDESTLGRYCAHNPRIRILRTDQDDISEGHTAADDADADHIVIRTNGTAIQVQAFSGGVPIAAAVCQPQ